MTVFSALLAAALLAASCFLPVPGFRNGPKKTPAVAPSTPSSRPPGTPAPPRKYARKGGVYHTVQRGQTISAIAQAYHVPQKDIVAANNIHDPSRIRVGQVLFIPGAKKAVAVASVNPRQPPGGRPSPPSGNFRPAPPPSTPSTAACPPGKVDFIWPLKGELTSGFGPRNDRMHDGIDLSNKVGSPVMAAADGVVIFSDRLGGYGLIVIIKHEGDLKTVYAHNSKNVAKKGAIVKQGDIVANLGNSGNATGPHLHFEIRCGQEAVDPLKYLPKK